MTSLCNRENCKEESTRRELIGLTAAGAGLLLVPRLRRKSRCVKSCIPCQQGPPFDVAGREQEIVEEAYQLGSAYEKQYGGCSQCTPTGLQNCGSFTAAGMAIGYLCGRRRSAEFEGTTKPSHALIRKLYKQYETSYGSVLCKDVRQKAERDCRHVVGLAAQWTAQILLDEFSTPSGGSGGR